MKFFRYLWALPNTLLGILLGFLGWSWPRREEGVLIFEDVIGLPKWILEFKGAAACCLGHTLLSYGSIEGKMFRHEMVHVSQYEKWGIFFIPAYVWSAHKMGDLNRFEVEAYKHQDDPRSPRTSNSFKSTVLQLLGIEPEWGCEWVTLRVLLGVN